MWVSRKKYIEKMKHAYDTGFGLGFEAGRSYEVSQEKNKASVLGGFNAGDTISDIEKFLEAHRIE